MGKDYRATEIEWEFLEDHFASIEEHVPFMHQMNEVLSRRLLELRARIEALEAAQQPQQDHIPDARKMVDTGWRRLHDLSPIMEPAPPATAVGLVERVAWRLADHNHDTNPEIWRPEARAAIREVASWLRNETTDSELISRAVADRLDQEANR